VLFSFFYLLATHSLLYLFLRALSGSTHAVDAASGAVRWSNATLGCSATGAAAGDGAVFVASRAGALVALEAGSGAHRWTARSSASEWARPVVAALDGGETLVYVRPSARPLATDYSSVAFSRSSF
jgi:outer membrane protein assembly factor BamB